MNQIVEIIQRSEQGVTRPFLCRADDGALYYVKGRGAGRRDLMCEWLGSCMARSFGLPVAEFRILYVPPALIEESNDRELTDLGSGYAFGSKRVSNVGDILASQGAHVPVDLRLAVLVFDKWIRNADRNLSERGGNPNLLWDSSGRSLVVIDHNQAFDESFSDERFLKSHIFAACAVEIAKPLRQAFFKQKFVATLAAWPEACENIPPDWWFVDTEHTIRTGFDLRSARTMLDEGQRQEFWSVFQ